MIFKICLALRLGFCKWMADSQPANCKLVGVRLFSIHFLGYLGVLTLSPRLTGGGN